MHPYDARHQRVSNFRGEDDSGREVSISDALRLPVRGVGWVLRWTAAVCLLLAGAAVLTEFAYCRSAERALSRAAQSGVLEATLPRATRQSVEQTLTRRLDGTVPKGLTRIAFLHNGAPVANKFLPRGGDRLSIVLVMPRVAAVPNWLRAFNFWRWLQRDAKIVVHAERQIPSPRLRAAQHQAR